MKENTIQLALSELHSCTLYLDRIYQALNEFTDIGHMPQVKRVNDLLVTEIREFFAEKILQSSEFENFEERHPGKVRDYLHQCFRFMDSAIQVSLWGQAEMAELLTTFMNKVYFRARQLHEILDDYTHLEVQLPRPIILESQMEEDEKVPLFFLTTERLLELSDQKGSTITSLEGKREKQYRQLISRGHKEILAKKYEKATDTFKSAQNYNDSAEVMTLLAWSYSLRGKMEKAKNYCLRAIQKDPDYGPPYNDLGNYLLQEGQGEEALKWFELAKKCSHYQNREYPYINAGRVYLSQREFHKAFEEFSKALALAPNHRELHQTINRLKKTIERSERNKQKNKSTNLEGPPPPPVF